MEEQKSLLSHIISLTEGRNIELLEISMLRTIYELVPCRMVYFLKTVSEEMEILNVSCYGKEGFTAACDSSWFAGSKSFVDSMILAIHDHSATSVDTLSQPFTICPVDIHGRNIGFIALDSPDTTTQDLYVLESLIRIYQNYVSVLIDNQRDTLTGLLNRKTFDDSIMKLIDLRKWRSDAGDEFENDRRRNGDSERSWLGIFDIDDFKRINDTYGHIYGDEILILLGRIVQDSFRSNDLKFRFGGEEFIVVISSESPENTYVIFERFRKNVESYSFPQVGRVTVSIGIVEITGFETPSVFVGCADRALYYAKNSGKNITFLYKELVDKGLIEPLKIKTGDVIIFDE